MSSLRGLLDTARSALMSHQMALNGTGHNVANVDSPGYSRQRLELGTRPGSEQRLDGIGAGVEPIALQRLRQETFDRAYRSEAAGLGMAERRDVLLRGVEAVVGEPGNPGVGVALDEFFSSWADLANEPSEESYRRAVLESGDRLASRLNQLDSQLMAQRRDMNDEVERIARQVNDKAGRIAELSRRIKASELGGQVSADLRDARDLLVDELSGLVELRAEEDATGSFRVWVGGRALVDGPQHFALNLEQSTDARGLVLTHLVWADSGRAFSPDGGELKGVLQVRDEILPARMAQLDALAANLVDQVNALHRQGKDLDGQSGLDFFDVAGRSAAGLRLSARLQDSPRKLAASLDGGVGNGEQAAAIGALAESGVAALSGRTLPEAWADLVSRSGVDAEKATADLDAQKAFVTELDNRRQSLSGVNLDEELAIMMQQEQAYNAAARVISVADGLMQTVLELV
jgi:flagellar hook-associated protein 1 FlgK